MAVEAARLLSDFFDRGPGPVRRQHADARPRRARRRCGSTSTSAGGWGCSTPRWTGARSRIATLPYRGEVAHKNTRLITASFAAGLMESALEEQVNLVNAEVLARERGIVIEEKTTDPRRLRHDDPDRGHDRAQDLRRRRARSSASSSSAWSGWARTGSTPISTAPS